jgi:hypothetical protein
MLNCKFFAEQVIPRCPGICSKPILVFNPEQFLNAAGDLTLEKFIEIVSERVPKQNREKLVEDMRNNVRFISRLNDGKNPAPPAVQLFLRTVCEIAYGAIDLGKKATDILVISSTQNLAKIADVLCKVDGPANFPENCKILCRGYVNLGLAANYTGHRINIDVAGYEIKNRQDGLLSAIPPSEFSLAVFLYFFRLANGEIANK